VRVAAQLLALSSLPKVGKTQYELNWPFSISTTHVLLSQLDFIIKLTASISKPLHHLDRYLGDFARGCRQPNAKILNRVVTATKLQAKQQKVNQLRQAVTSIS
jgi:hypothetical protein